MNQKEKAGNPILLEELVIIWMPGLFPLLYNTRSILEARSWMRLQLVPCYKLLILFKLFNPLSLTTYRNTLLVRKKWVKFDTTNGSENLFSCFLILVAFPFIGLVESNIEYPTVSKSILVVKIKKLSIECLLLHFGNFADVNKYIFKEWILNTYYVVGIIWLNQAM